MGLSDFVSTAWNQFLKDSDRVGYIDAFARFWVPVYQEAAIREDLASGIPIKDILWEFEKDGKDPFLQTISSEDKWLAISLIADDLSAQKKERINQFLVGLAYLVKKEDDFGKSNPRYYSDFCTWNEDSPYNAQLIEQTIQNLDISSILKEIDDIKRLKGYQNQYKRLLKLREQFGKIQHCDQTGGVLQLANFALHKFLMNNKPFPIKAVSLSAVALLSLYFVVR